MFGGNYLSAQEEEEYLHFLACMDDFQNAWVILKDIEAAGEHPLVAPAFGYALVQYARPYIAAETVSGHRRILSQQYIPQIFLELHKNLVEERHKIHAHSDLRITKPQISLVSKFSETVLVTIGKNHILRFSTLRRIKEVISLIEGTLDNMFTDKIKRDSAIFAKKQAFETLSK